jgi:hypothetical protein
MTTAAANDSCRPDWAPAEDSVMTRSNDHVHLEPDPLTPVFAHHGVRHRFTGE